MSRRESGRQTGGKGEDFGNDLEQGPDPEAQDGGAYMYGEMAGEEEEEADNTMLIVGIIVCVLIVFVIVVLFLLWHFECLCAKPPLDKLKAACEKEVVKDKASGDACTKAIEEFNKAGAHADSKKVIDECLGAIKTAGDFKADAAEANKAAPKACATMASEAKVKE